MRTLVVLPTYNESENVARVLERVRAALPDGSVLVVDDSSPDGTADIAVELGKRLGNIEVVRRAAKSGLGNAYRDGFRWGLEHGFDVMVEMDADLSHQPEALPAVIAPIGDDFDLVVGSRYIPGGVIPKWTLSRRLLSRGGNIYAALMLGLPVKDSTSGFRAYSSHILGKLDLNEIHAEGYGFQIEMVHQVIAHGGRVTEVPISFVDRVDGESKMSRHIVIEALFLVTKWGVQQRLSNGRQKREGARASKVSAG